MSESSGIILTLGILFLLGLAVDALGRFTRLPRVTLLLLLGVGVGPAGLGFLNLESSEALATVAEVALLLIGFLLGEKLSARKLRGHGRGVLAYSLSVSLGTALFVTIVLPMLGVPVELALVLGAIAAATDPAATMDVVQETGAKGPFTDTLMGTVALDDAWGLVIFSVMLLAAQSVAGQGLSINALGAAAWEIGGGLLLGVALGIPVALLSGRIRPGEPMLLEALGIVFLCGGLANRFGIAPLFATMVLGATVANLARHHARPFHAIDEVDGPFLVVLFIFAGASLRLEALAEVGWLGAAYVVLRVLGRIFGGLLGGRFSGDGRVHRLWIGPALLPQAGVALGMGLLAANRMPELAEVVLPIVVGSTVVFELVGPVLTKVALSRVGEVARENRGANDLAT